MIDLGLDLNINQPKLGSAAIWAMIGLNTLSHLLTNTLVIRK